MRILLTGATGFIGSAFLRLALEQGHEVAGLILPGEPTPASPSLTKAQWLRGALDQVPWAEVGQFRPNVCVHTAWITAPGEYLESPLNRQFLSWSHEFVRKSVAAGVEHVITLGTCIEYQPGPHPLSETGTIEPVSLYARCKNELRERLEADARNLGFTLGWGRVFYPYGVGEHPDRLCSALIRKLKAGGTVTLKTPDSVKDYIHISDLGNALLKLVETRHAGPINLGTGIGISVRSIAQTVASALDASPRLLESPGAIRDPFDHVVADATRLRSLGWTPGTSLAEGVAGLIRAH